MTYVRQIQLNECLDIDIGTGMFILGQGQVKIPNVVIDNGQIHFCYSGI